MSILACTNCDWVGHNYQLHETPLEALWRLQPGEVIPHGACPNCGAVMHVGKTPQIEEGDWSWEDRREERPNLSQFQRDCLLTALARIDPKHPGFQGDDNIKEALSGPCRLYLQTWVIPLLTGALYGETFPGQRDYARGDANAIRYKLQKEKTL